MTYIGNLPASGCMKCGAQSREKCKFPFRRDASCRYHESQTMRPGSLTWIDTLPVLRLTAREFMELPEYSATVPTGAFIGKRWRCLVGSHDLPWCQAGGIPRWVIREYVAVADPKMAGIKQYRPIVIVRSP
jgi:hypothetical protein